MISEYYKILKIKLTILGNQQLYSFKSSTIFKNIFKDTSYDNPTVILFLAIYNFVKETIKLLLFNIFLIIILLYIPALLIEISYELPIIHPRVTLFTGLTFYIPLIAVLSNKIFKADEKKYNIVHLLKYNPKQYTISEIIKYLIMTTLILIPSLAFSKVVINTNYLVYLPTIYYINTYLYTNFYFLRLYEKEHIIITQDKKRFYKILLSLVFLPFLLAIFNIGIRRHTFIAINIILLIINIYYMIWYSKTKCIQRLYKENYSSYLNVVDDDQIIARRLDNSIKITNKSSNLIEKETGFKFFNDLFMIRHDKILKESTKIFSIIIIFVSATAILTMLLLPETKPYISDAITNNYLYFLYIIMVSNQGIRIIRAMFFHCDRSMLKYNFYKNKNTILNLYKLRIFSLIKINLPITILVTLGLDIVYILSSGINIPILLLLTISTIIISNFFSIYYLSLYYLLQPFTNNMKDNNFKFNAIIFITFITIYEIAENIEINIIPATISCIIVCLIITLIFFINVYKRSYKTFKLRNE